MSAAAPAKTQARFDNYHLYSVELGNDDHVELFKQLEAESDSLSFYGYAREINEKLTILVAAHRIADFVDLLQIYRVKYTVLCSNFQEKIDRSLSEVMPIGTDALQIDWSHFFHLDTIYAWMQLMVEKYPKDLTLLDIGYSTQGTPIKGLKLARDPANKAIFIEGGIHAREWIAPASATFIIKELLTSKKKDVKALAKNYNWIVFPCVNPDGYKYSLEHNRFWRKNRSLYGCNRGVDLNRNFPDHWNSVGCSSEPRFCDYAGPAAASEMEVKSVVQYLIENTSKEQIKAYFALHSYSQMILFPYGHTLDRVPNFEDLEELAQGACERIKGFSGKTYTCGSSIETIYPTSGESTDWAYNAMKIMISYTIELRGAPDNEDLFILPANEIEPTAMEAFLAIESIVQKATEKGYF